MTELEKALFGACVIKPGVFAIVAGEMEPDDFTPPAKAVFLAMSVLSTKGRDIELVGLRHTLSESGNFEVAGGLPMLATLGEGVYGVSENKVLGWVADLKTVAKRRRLVQGVSNLLESSESADVPYESLLATLQAVSFNLDYGKPQGTSFDPIGLRRAAAAYMDEISEAKNGIVGIASGLHAVDKLTGGFRAGQYVSIGARPSVGKSSLALQIADHAAYRGNVVVFFSLEMEARSLALIRACGEAQVSKFQIQIKPQGEHVEKVYEILKRQAETPLYVERMPAASVGPMTARASRIKAEHGLGLIVVDYLQLMRAEGKRSNRNEEITEISAGLKNMAGTLGVPVIVCAQLNREAADKSNPRPRLSNFRDSGSVEADSDIAILLHRPKENEPRNSYDPIDVDLIVDKNREGACGDAPCTFIGKYQRFYEREQTL